MSKRLPGFSGFNIGVNYWASHAGTGMWRNFSAKEVETDFAALEQAGIRTVRLFPTWSDFQPLMAICEFQNSFREIGFTDGTPVSATGLRSFGLSQTMMQRFRTVADLAAKHHLKLVVGLLTGWMSGGIFVPPVISGKNLLEDPLALRIAEMFVRGFVGYMKDHPAIIAWEPGNECNCLSTSNADSSWVWLHTICSAIRLADPTRPVFSGMHGGSPDKHQAFNLLITGELCDAVTTHPYPAFTPHCGKSALNNIPAIYHSIAETLYYRGISGKPAFIEEIGSFGPGYLSGERTEKYLYTILYSALIHGIDSVMWWCGFSFDRCAFEMPYRWGSMERELGAFKSDRTPDGAGEAIIRFNNETAALPTIPEREIDAIVVLTTLDDAWKTAYGSFILSKQAGFEIEYCNIASIDTLPASKFYIVPSISGYEVMDIHKYHLLLDAAFSGSTVVFTADSGFLQPFAETFGLEVDYRTEVPETIHFSLSSRKLAVNQSISRKIKAKGGKVCAVDSEKNPLIIAKSYGEGKLIFVNAALENNALEPDNNLFVVYRKLAELAQIKLPDKSPEIGVTRHKLPNGKYLIFYINYSEDTVDDMPGNSIRYKII